MFTLYQITFGLALDLLSVNSYVIFFTVSVCIIPDSFLSHHKKLTQCYYNIHVAQAINAAKAVSVNWSYNKDFSQMELNVFHVTWHFAADEYVFWKMDHNSSQNV